MAFKDKFLSDLAAINKILDTRGERVDKKEIAQRFQEFNEDEHTFRIEFVSGFIVFHMGKILEITSSSPEVIDRLMNHKKIPGVQRTFYLLRAYTPLIHFNYDSASYEPTTINLAHEGYKSVPQLRNYKEPAYQMLRGVLDEVQHGEKEFIYIRPEVRALFLEKIPEAKQTEIIARCNVVPYQSGMRLEFRSRKDASERASKAKPLVSTYVEGGGDPGDIAPTAGAGLPNPSATTQREEEMKEAVLKKIDEALLSKGRSVIQDEKMLAFFRQYFSVGQLLASGIQATSLEAKEVTLYISEDTQKTRQSNGWARLLQRVKNEVKESGDVIWLNEPSAIEKIVNNRILRGFLQKECDVVCLWVNPPAEEEDRTPNMLGITKEAPPEDEFLI